jgi:GTP cyclohydrolase III
MVGMCVLSQVISVSSCERDLTGLLTGTLQQIQTKIHNKLSSEAAEKLVYIYSKMTETCLYLLKNDMDANELKTFAWDIEDVQPASVSIQDRACME